MEGRDITTVVLPNANLKIYLTANQNERARRRQIQLQQSGSKESYSRILKETKIRDKRDKERDISPLMVAPNAVVIDSTNITIKQVVDKILNELKK